jgi:zinc transport system substrate-binding protein
LDELNGKIEAVNGRIEKMLRPHRGKTFYVYHPSFGYFADAYGLKEEAIQLGGQSRSAKELRALIEEAKADGVKTIFVQPQFSPQSAETVAHEIGAKVVVIDDLANDVLGNLEKTAEAMHKAFAEERK